MKSVTFRLTMFLAAIAFAATLAIIVGQRLSSEAMAVLLGVVAGVGASIPTSLIVVWLASRSAARPVEAAGGPRVEPHQVEPTRVVVMQPPQAGYGYGATAPQYAPWGRPMPYPAMAAPPAGPRKFTVIGGASDADELVAWHDVEAE